MRFGIVGVLLTATHSLQVYSCHGTALLPLTVYADDVQYFYDLLLYGCKTTYLCSC